MKRTVLFILLACVLCASLACIAYADDHAHTCDVAACGESIQLLAVSGGTLSCGHGMEVYTSMGSYHVVTCGYPGCTVSDTGYHSPTACEAYRCDLCGYRTYINHNMTTEVVTLCYVDGMETHGFKCTNTYYPFGECEETSGVEYCIDYVSGSPWYFPAENGQHDIFRECSVCHWWPYIETQACALAQGYNTCAICELAQ